jgi:hypothetical protein
MFRSFADMRLNIVKGSVALYAGSILKAGTPKFVDQVTQAFTSTAVPLKHGKNYQSVVQQGSGTIDIFSAITQSTIVSPSFLLLNDTRFCKGRQTFTCESFTNLASLLTPSNQWRTSLARL